MRPRHLRQLDKGPPQRPDIVAIGASAGGVEAVLSLLERFPANFPAAVLVVVHRPVETASRLYHILSRSIKLPILIAEEGQVLKKGLCLIGEPNRHLTVDANLRVHMLPDSFYRTHNIDALLCSLAGHAAARTIGVVLTGLRKDGALGLRTIKEAGGMALVQSPKEAAYAEMPESAIEAAGEVDLIAPIDVLVRKICELVGEAAPAGLRTAAEGARNRVAE